MLDPVPHFSTFGKNYTRRFKDTDLFEQIFSKILEECMKFKLVDTEHIFVDSTHVKACANSKRMRKRVAHEQALWYEQDLKEEIQKDREAHGKKPLKDNDKNDSPPPTASAVSYTHLDVYKRQPLECPDCKHKMELLELYYNHKRVSLEELYERAMSKSFGKRSSA